MRGLINVHDCNDVVIIGDGKSLKATKTGSQQFKIKINDEEQTMDLSSPTKLIDLNEAKKANSENDDANVVALSQGQMSQLLSDQMRKSLEKMAREILPDIAERLIKAEIHKMLAETQGPQDQTTDNS